MQQLREREFFWMVDLNSIYPNGYNINDEMNNVLTSTSSSNDYETPKDPISIVRGIIGRKWKWEIVWQLHKEGNTRFNELKRRIHGITHFMLTKSLRELENDGLVVRCECISTPPKVVEYSLTTLGKEFIPALNELYAWGQKVMLNDKN